MAKELEVPEVGEQTLGVHDVHAVPLVGLKRASVFDENFMSELMKMMGRYLES